MAQWPENTELIEAVRDAGWLLEHHALRVLDQAGAHARAGWAFQDVDEPAISRELDVWAYRQLLRDEANKIMVSARFLVECKQSALPYVGIGYEMPVWRFRKNPTQHVLPMSDVRMPATVPGSFTVKPAWDHFGFRSVAREHGESNFRVTQLTRLDRAKGGWLDGHKRWHFYIPRLSARKGATRLTEGI